MKEKSWDTFKSTITAKTLLGEAENDMDHACLLAVMNKH